MWPLNSTLGFRPWWLSFRILLCKQEVVGSSPIVSTEEAGSEGMPVLRAISEAGRATA